MMTITSNSNNVVNNNNNNIEQENNLQQIRRQTTIKTKTTNQQEEQHHQQNRQEENQGTIINMQHRYQNRVSNRSQNASSSNNSINEMMTFRRVARWITSIMIVTLLFGHNYCPESSLSSLSSYGIMMVNGQSDYYSQGGNDGSGGGGYYDPNDPSGGGAGGAGYYDPNDPSGGGAGGAGYYDPNDPSGGGAGGGGGGYGDEPMSDEDNLYANYAKNQQDKMLGGNPNGAGIGYVKLFMGCAASWYMGGKYHSDRISKKLKLKFQKEQKQLYTQYYNDVYKLSETNVELSNYIETLKDTLKQTEHAHELEAIQRDYDEFKQPDIDGDDRISRAEFNMYVKNYLSNYPGLTEADYPKFEDFDHDHDGFVSFKEYAQQMALQAEQAELEQLYGKDNTDKPSQKSIDKSKAYNDMYGDSVGKSRTKMYK